MPIEPIPLHKGMLADSSESRIAESTEVDEVSSYSPKLIDCMVDKNGYIHKRFGLSEFEDLGTSGRVHALYHWKPQSVIVAASTATGNDIFTVTEGGTATGRGDTDDVFYFKPATFVDWGDTLYICLGADIEKLTDAFAFSTLGDADIPSVCDDITSLDQYLIATKQNTGQFHFSEVGTPETWGGDFATAEAEQDYLLRSVARNQRLYLFGQNTIEIWYDDGVTPFVKSPQGLIHSGLRSSMALTWSDYLNTFVWAKNPLNIVMLKGLNAVPISDDLSKYLDVLLYSTQINLNIFSAEIEAYPLLFFEMRGLSQSPVVVYDIRTGLIYEWHYYDSANTQYDTFRGCSHTFVNGASDTFHLMGDRANGKIWKLSTSYKDDSGDTIRSLIRSPSIDRGYNDSWKYCKKLTFRLKRTADVAAGNPSSISLSVRYRDNGSVTWSTARTITCSAGAVNDTEYFARSTRWGRYKSRQWEIVIDDSVPCCLLPVLEEFDYT